MNGLVQENIVSNFYTLNKENAVSGIGETVIEDPSTITGEFLTSTLGFNPQIWNLIDIDITSTAKYPTLKHEIDNEIKDLVY